MADNINSTPKVSLEYTIRNIHNVRTGEKTKRAFPITNGTITLDQFCSELAEDDGFMAGKKSYIKGFISNMFSKLYEELQHGNTVVLDDYIRFYPTFRGKVDAETGRPTAETTLAVRVRTSKGLQLDINAFTLVNREGTAAEPKLTAIYSQASMVADKVVRSKEFSILGRNLYYSAELQDTVTISYTEDGEAKSLTVVPSDVTSGYMRFEFPEALTNVADNTELEFTLRTRFGVEEAAFSVASRKAVLVSA